MITHFQGHHHREQKPAARACGIGINASLFWCVFSFLNLETAKPEWLILSFTLVVVLLRVVSREVLEAAALFCVQPSS